jgi:hypothetical protein
MTNFAVLGPNKKVINVIVADSKEIAEEATKLECIQSDIAKINDIWDGTNFVSPVIEEPVEE